MDTQDLITALMTVFNYCNEKTNDEVLSSSEHSEANSKINVPSIDVIETLRTTMLTVMEENASKVEFLNVKLETMGKCIETLNNSIEASQQTNKNEITTVISHLMDKVNSLEEKLDNTHQNEITLLKSQNDTLKRELEEKKQDISTQSTMITSLEERCIIAENKTQEVQNQLSEELCKYDGLKDILAVKECICLMSPAHRSYIESLCGSNDLLAIISLGRDEGKLKQLWQYLRDEAVQEDADIHNLNSYFEFSIYVFNVSRSEDERYAVQDISVGSEFDLNLCIKTKNSVQIGNISSILTSCIIRKNIVIYKAVVKVE